jgi:hypothetical protein
MVLFEYGYNMACPSCSAVTFLTSEEHYRQDNDVHTTCACYGADIEVSRAVLALRDIDDPVLDDHHLFDVAWYHTSIHDRERGKVWSRQ